jgi:hypothetical protein
MAGIGYNRIFRKPENNIPEMKVPVTIVDDNPELYLIDLYATDEAAKKFREFGTVLETAISHRFTMVVDARFDFNEVLNYIEDGYATRNSENELYQASDESKKYHRVVRWFDSVGWVDISDISSVSLRENDVIDSEICDPSWRTFVPKSMYLKELKHSPNCFMLKKK